MSEVLMKLSPHVRGQMATKLLEGAEKLGMEPSVVRSQSEGFKVPEELHRYLFPSEYEDSDESGDGQDNGDDSGTATGQGDKSGDGQDNGDGKTNAADDFSDLSESELDALTDPDASK